MVLTRTQSWCLRARNDFHLPGAAADVAACPVNLHEHLADSFLAADKVLLKHLSGMMTYCVLDSG